MGALTDSRKRRALDQRLLSPPLYPDSPPPPSKKPKLAEPPPAMEPPQPHQEPRRARDVAEVAADGDGMPSRPRFPPPALRRPVHAPQRVLRAFGLGSGSGSDSSRFGREIPSYRKDTSAAGPSEEVQSRGLKRGASVLSARTDRNVEVVDLSGVLDDVDAQVASTLEEENGEIGAGRGLESQKRFSKSIKKVSNSKSKSGCLDVSKGCHQSELGLSKVSKNLLDSEFEFSETPKKVVGCKLASTLTTVMNTPEIARSSPSLEQYKKLVSSVSNFREPRVLSKQVPLYKELYNQSARSHDSRLKDLEYEVKLAETRIAKSKLLGEILDSKHEDVSELFTPLTDEEEKRVKQVLNGRSSGEVLVAHEASNIEITKEIMQCLKFGAWLNDEVINVYLELLKERERKEPKKFLRCHFFNTFFYKKLTGGHSGGYDFKAVRRWTTQRKLGYALIDCDKVFVPIHKEVHWCLAVINVKDKKLQYLDSLGGMDTVVLRTLAKYFADEVKEKSGKQIDTSSWEIEDCPDLPLQENGWDCGMFMLKYIDFLSRGLSLSFSQEHMLYFRKRTVKELLSLRAA